MSLSEIHVINAKIRAIKSYMFENHRLLNLLQSKNEEEVAIHVFPDLLISSIGTNIVREFEIKIHNDAMKTFKKLVKYSNTLRPLMLTLIRRFEITNLKKIVKAIIYPRYKKDVRFLDISPYSSFHPKHAVKCKTLQELSEFLVNTRYKKIFTEENCKSQNAAFTLSNKLDLLDYENLFSLHSLFTGKGKTAYLQLLKTEASYKNLLWILRLKYYYEVPLEDLPNYVISHDKFKFDEKKYEDMFDARYDDEILMEIPAEYKNRIEKMYRKTYKKDINYEKITFKEIEMCIQKILKETYYLFLYNRYLTAAPILCFFNLKLIEITNLNSIVEGFRFEMNRDEIKSLLI